MSLSVSPSRTKDPNNSNKLAHQAARHSTLHLRRVVFSVLRSLAAACPADTACLLEAVHSNPVDNPAAEGRSSARTGHTPTATAVPTVLAAAIGFDCMGRHRNAVLEVAIVDSLVAAPRVRCIYCGRPFRG